MSDRLEVFHVTAVAGTLSSAPQTDALSFVDGIVTEVQIVVPPGPSGLSGFQLRYGGVQQIPNTSGQFIITDNEKISWPITGYPTGSRWQLTTYNTDVHDHTYEVRFLIDEFPPKPAPTVTPLVILQPNQTAPAIEG